MRNNSLKKKTFRWLTRNDDSVLIISTKQPLKRIQPQISLTMLLVRSVALYTVM